jgi:predicted Zn-dependent protease
MSFRPSSTVSSVAIAGLLLSSGVFAAPAVGPLSRGPATSTPSSTSTAPAGNASAYQRGLEALVRNDLKAAEQAFRSSLETNPADAPSMLGMGELAFRAKKLEEAIDWIQRSLKADPNSVDAHISLGRAHTLKNLSLIHI